MVVTDASKFGRRGFIRVAGLDGIDAVVTDRAPPDAVAAALAAANVAVSLAAPAGEGA